MRDCKHWDLCKPLGDCFCQLRDSYYETKILLKDLLQMNLDEAQRLRYEFELKKTEDMIKKVGAYKFRRRHTK